MSCEQFPNSCDMRTEITIQRFSMIPDAVGGRKREWGPIERTWGKWTDGSSSERFFADGKKAVTTASVTIRFTDVTPKDRILVNGLVHAITGIVDIAKRQRFMKISIADGEQP